MGVFRFLPVHPDNRPVVLLNLLSPQGQAGNKGYIESGFNAHGDRLGCICLEKFLEMRLFMYWVAFPSRLATR